MAERELPTAGKAAYEKFAEGSVNGLPLRFEGLSDEAKARWEAVAQAAIEANYALWGPDKCRNCH